MCTRAASFPWPLKVRLYPPAINIRDVSLKVKELPGPTAGSFHLWSRSSYTGIISLAIKELRGPTGIVSLVVNELHEPIGIIPLVAKELHEPTGIVSLVVK